MGRSNVFAFVLGTKNKELEQLQKVYQSRLFKVTMRKTFNL